MAPSIFSAQRAFLISLGAHLMLFGTALAFAQYTHGLFTYAPAAITVSLVGGPGRSGGFPKTDAVPSVRRSEIPALPLIPQADHDLAGEAKTEEKVPAAQGDSEGTGLADAGKGSGDGSAAAGEADRGTAGTFSLEQWRQLYSAIERAKTYPRLARERGIEGTVLVRFKVLPSGTVDAVNIIKSSGAEILDEASVRTVYRAAPMPYVNGWVEVPLSYVLK